MHGFSSFNSNRWHVGIHRNPCNRAPFQAPGVYNARPMARFTPNLLEEIFPSDGHRPAGGPPREAHPQGPGVLGLLSVPSGKVRLLQGRERAPCLSLLRLRQGRRRLQMADRDQGLSFPEAVERRPARRAWNCPNGRRKTRSARTRKSLTDVVELPANFSRRSCRTAGARSPRVPQAPRPGRRSRQEIPSRLSPTGNGR